MSSALAVSATSTNASFTAAGNAIGCDAPRFPLPLAARLEEGAAVVSAFSLAAGVSAFASCTCASGSATTGASAKFISTCSGDAVASSLASGAVSACVVLASTAGSVCAAGAFLQRCFLALKFELPQPV